MREFIYFSQGARTSGNFDVGKLMEAGRMDIAIHSFIQGVFLSHGFRKDAVFHFVFYGQPDPPKHIEIRITDELEISKKDVGNLIKKILYKYKPGKKTEVLSGCWIEKKSFLNVAEELGKEGKQIFILDKKGEDIRKAKIKDNCVFILGDQEGLPKKELKRLKEIATPVSVGEKMYFASQTVAVVNNELDYRGI
ncbi:MAG: tRNA (pseudouridine(54)-N(1))-methyltransferase TrmY [Candidatus Nanoarchaeia archaeon]|nr:tRNA (pseudouridine(54)-N(1))-methyltransferase TrmY [Candidatus Nanoarchaeia archaeon]MDD5357596.1 tRNA (pseudouridine(54)-N(1))-methyltransferase TrmY [Candidatus Nanoarchaeia archaeon]MDD5588515.1 tRNA (pseudouridine(54)-N(1))-methyltransferase TrmY [Candidatus Nanoarchaeia archaeon]